ncbi:MAG TPA: hypothetical protein VE035_10980 [Puia sp.]|nr:hypothetical protein [Puia sp.]
MKTTSTQHEILLITGTSFASSLRVLKDDPGKDRFTEKEQLEEACWNGLLQEMLPEVYTKIDGAGILYLWQIREAAFFLELEIGEFPAEIDKFYSVDPYSFMETKTYS